MPQIRYRTNDVPRWGTAAFTPVVPPTPLASTGGEQVRRLQQWTAADDPNLAGFSPTAPQNLSIQGSYANVGRSPDFSGQPSYDGERRLPNRQAMIEDKTFVPGLPLAFRPVVNLRHFMQLFTEPRDGAGRQSMGPNGYNTHMKIWSDNPLPVPARNPGRVAMPAFRTQPKGTIIATAWPRPFISWPTWGQSRQA